MTTRRRIAANRFESPKSIGPRDVEVTPTAAPIAFPQPQPRAFPERLSGPNYFTLVQHPFHTSHCFVLNNLPHILDARDRPRKLKNDETNRTQTLKVDFPNQIGR